MIDKLILTIMIIALMFGTHYAAFEMGKKYQCTLDKDYAYSMDYSKCIRVGSENMK